MQFNKSVEAKGIPFLFSRRFLASFYRVFINFFFNDEQH